MDKFCTKRLVIVLGMHRSGTSAITRGLMALGVDLGDNLMPPLEENNEKGFWEDIDISNLDDEILHYLGHDWHTLKLIRQTEFERNDLAPFEHRAEELLRETTKDKTVFGLKDPRIARLLPFWKIIFNKLDIEVSYVITIRHPLSVVQSLNKRDGFELEKSSYLWLNHLVPAVLDSEGNRRIVVDYDLLMAHPKKQLYRIAEALKLPFDASSPGIDTYIKEFLSDELRHTQFCIDDLTNTPGVPKDVVEAFCLLDKLARDEMSVSSEKVHECFTQLAIFLDKMSPAFNYMTRSDEQIVNLKHILSDCKRQIDNLNQMIAEHDKQRIERDALITAIKSSYSWKITWPLRFIGTVIDNLKR